MRSSCFAVLFAAASCGVLHAAEVEPDVFGDPKAIGTYVVTFEQPGLVETVASAPYPAWKAGAVGRTLDVASKSASDLRKVLADDRELLLAGAARQLGRSIKPLHVYDLAMNGVALKLSREEALELAAMPGVRRVEPERLLYLQMDLSPAWLGATTFWSAPSPFGNKGAGVVVGIIDSGLNRTHPAFAGVGPVDGFVHSSPLGKVFGRCVDAPGKCNGKLIGIYDYTDEGQLDGIDQSSHGSLVASIAVGNTVDVTFSGKVTRISGIAPNASLIVYKTCISDTNGSCEVSDVIAALEQAIEDGVDVVNMSLGYMPTNPWICLESDCTGPPWDSLSEVLLNVHAAGIVGVVAAANNGPLPKSIPAPGVSPWVITVASARHDRVAGKANELAASSGRGPGPVGGYLIPDVTAPGVDILGVGAGAATVVGFGTSMASPQVAGAAALLRGAHADWTVADIASVLVTTARPVITLPGGVTPAGLFDQGGGLVDLPQALNAGLSLRIDSNAYRAASPLLGGSVSAMNEPALILDKCFRTCSVTRTLTALKSGTWSVVPEIDAGVSVTATPAEFTLAAGQTQAVTFTINGEARAGEWTYGAVRLKRTDAVATDARLPMAVFADPGPVPAEIVVQASSDAGHADVALPGLVALPDLTFSLSALAEVFTRTEPLPKGPTPNPFLANAGGADGAFAQFVTIPANSGNVTLKVETLDSPAVEVQLYVGRDINANGKTEQTETQCASTKAGDRELCLIEVPDSSVANTYWFVANNREASTPGATDPVTMRWVVLKPSAGDGKVTVTGPGHVDSGEAFSLRVSWKDFTLTPGAERETLLKIGSKPGQVANVGAIPLKLVRSGDAATTAAALVPGKAVPVRLLPGEAEDRLYVDVPPNASALSVTLAGSGEVNVYAARVADPTEPAIAPAPARTLAVASSSAAGANDTLVVDGAQLQPGRWYLTPVNTGTQLAEFTLTTTLSYGAVRAEPKQGAYFNTARSGAGGFFYRAGSTWAYIWYTYLQDGTPTWYLGANAAPGAQEGTWVVPLDRYTWDGAQASATRVGEGIMTLVSPTELQFSWNLDGESGSESYTFIDGGGCPAGITTNVTGSWFAPERPGYGYSVSLYAAVASAAAYFYDDMGIPRWAIGADTNGLSGSMVMSQYRGVGPLAPYQAPTSEAIGTFQRTFTQSAGNGHLDLELATPLTGGWDTAHALQKLTDTLGCSN